MTWVGDEGKRSQPDCPADFPGVHQFGWMELTDTGLCPLGGFYWGRGAACYSWRTVSEISSSDLAGRHSEKVKKVTSFRVEIV